MDPAPEPATVRVPEPLRPLFLRAEEYVRRYFAEMSCRPPEGSISISGERYILMRAASLSVEFHRLMIALYRDRGEAEARRAAQGFLFDLAHAVGRADARAFHRRMKLDTALAKLSAGPVHFAHCGWALVDISPESHPTTDADYFLLYDHPYSFEAASWLESGLRPDFPVCVMNAGYSSGWCEESFGLPLVAVETQCRARGDEHCRFVMAPPSRIEAHLARYGVAGADRSGGAAQAIPEFFERKRLEDELLREKDLLADAKRRLEQVYHLVPSGLFTVDPNRVITSFNQVASRITGYRPEEVIGRSCEVFTLEPCSCRCGLFADDVPKPIQSRECTIRTKDGRVHTIRKNAELIRDAAGRVTGGVESFDDVTDLKLMEQALQEKKKLEGALETAGAVAHEFNQPLQAIAGYAQFLDEDLPLEGALRAQLRRIREQVGRLGELTRRLGSITGCRSREYPGGGRILDLEASSGAAEPSPEPPQK